MAPTPLSEAQAALAELRKATLGFQNARKANLNDWLQTHNSLCEQHIVAVIKLLGGTAAITPKLPTPLPPSPVPVSKGIAPTLVIASDPMRWLDTPSYYELAVVADYGYRQWYADGRFVAEAKRRGRVVKAWCDCRVDGTLPDVAKHMVEEFGLAGWIGQAETSAEFANAYAAGATVMVGNLSALTAEQKQLIALGRVAFVQEDYWNVMPWTAPNWENLPVQASLVACYDASGENPNGGRKLPLAAYVQAGRFVAHRDWLYTEGCDVVDQSVLKALG